MYKNIYSKRRLVRLWCSAALRGDFTWPNELSAFHMLVTVSDAFIIIGYLGEYKWISVSCWFISLINVSCLDQIQRNIPVSMPRCVILDIITRLAASQFINIIEYRNGHICVERKTCSSNPSGTHTHAHAAKIEPWIQLENKHSKRQQTDGQAVF